MSTPKSVRNHPWTRSTDAQRSVRWRLRAAMVVLALVPAAAGIYLTASLLDPVEPAAVADHSRQASVAAASLLARQQGIESRLLLAAADADAAVLLNGINGSADRAVASRLLDLLQGGDGAAVRAACITRARDGRSTVLADDAESDTGAVCADGSLQRRAIEAATATMTRAPAVGGGSQSLLLVTPLRSVSGRNSGVISAEIDVAALFDRARLPAGDAVASMLVDMGSSEVVASSPLVTDPVDGAVAASVTPETIAPHVEGIVGADQATERDLARIGLASTIVPLWNNGDGSRMGLVQLWANGSAPMPTGVLLAMLVLLAGAILAVIVLVRHFLAPFDKTAVSRDELQVPYRAGREDPLTDGLTGLGNHRAFQEELARQVTAHEQRGGTFSLALLDLDDLKLVNDREGHVAGDDMLRSMARHMREMARANDRLFRTGGDEFAIILPSADIEDAVAVARRILHVCDRLPDSERPFAFSGGVSGVPRFTGQGDRVYRQAGAALHRAKCRGGGSIEVFDPERDQVPDEVNAAAGNAAAGNAVAEVVQGGLLRPVFQPIVDLRTGHILGFEGLIRPDPNGPLPDAGKLFAAAAASGRTVELDLACLEVVVNAARAIGPGRLLTLNVSPRTLEMKGFDAAWLLSGLVRNGISPSRVIIELTERDEISDLGRLRQTFADLQQHGLRLAADDVGAGNSGLRLLSQVQFDIVKIDLSLVHDGVRRLGSRAVLQSLRDLAVSQDARIVAEGVETSEQLNVIRDLQIGAGQGYLLGRPEASVAKTFVDMQQLQGGMIVPTAAALPVVTAAAPEATDDAISAERLAMFLPPARRRQLDAGASPA